MWLAIGILFVVLLIGLFSIPFGFPGLVIMAIGVIVYELVLVGQQFTTLALIIISILALLSELFDWWLTARYTTKAGASRRGSWGALLGGIIGAVIGVPIPIIGSVIGSLIGLFAGAYLAERLINTHQKATQIGWAALTSRLISTAVKFGIGVGIIIWAIILIL
jgi:uncharacterized protein YqgC (DUF456 family)